jgi:hypothetical protein
MTHRVIYESTSQMKCSFTADSIAAQIQCGQ